MSYKKALPKKMKILFFFSEFSHQTKTVYVGGLEDGIDDPELKAYFSEFGFVTRALRYVFASLH